MAKTSAVKAATTGDEPVSASMQKCLTTLSLLGMAIEVQRGACAVTAKIDHADGMNDGKPGVAVIWVTVTLGEKAPETKALIVNGELFISVLDAGAASVRERSRLLAVARRAGNA
jgi:hypothetical protein